MMQRLLNQLHQLPMVLVAVLFGLWHMPAKADAYPLWQRITTDQGCIATIYDYNDSEEAGNWRVYHWSGTCSAGSEINGQGSLQTHFMEYGEASVQVEAGTMVGGYFQGEVRSAFYAVNGQGRWDSRRPDGEISTQQYSRGCPTDSEFCQQDRGNVFMARTYGQRRFEDVNAQSMAANEGGGSGGNTGQPSGRAAAPAPAASSGNGDVFGQCVRLESLGQPGIQMIWQLKNACNVRVKVAYCFRSKFESAGDTNLCRHGDYLNGSIATGEAIEFAYTLGTDGTFMSDGRMIQDDALTVVGYACANGNSPSVGFSDGQFRFSGC